MQLSGASPLPHLTEYPPWNAVKCGRGLAPDGNDPANTKPQPVDLGIPIELHPPTFDRLPTLECSQMWEGACSRWQWPSQHKTPAKKNAPACRPGHFLLSHTHPHITDYPPW